MTKRTKENLGFLILGGALSFLVCEWTILERGTQIEQQAEIIDAYDQYWHSIEDQDMLQIADRFHYEDSLAINYNEAREKLIKVTNRYESNPNHKHQ
jgi:uncharacterized protein YxjI